MLNYLSLYESMEYFNSLAPLLRTFWFIAIPASGIFIIQTILTFMGFDGSDGMDADFDGDLDTDGGGVGQYFSLRNFINLLLGFSWTGVLFYDEISNKTFLVLLATAVGLLFVLLFFWAINQVKNLAEDNTFHLEQTVGKLGEVYIPIPANMSGKGKVTVSVNGSTHELEAVTDSDTKLPTASMVRILSIENDSILKVEKV